MKIAIITAMPEETGALLNRLGVSAQAAAAGFPTSNGHELVIREAGGMGFDNAARAAENVISTCRPDLLLSCGFCGGISPDLKVGDVVAAVEVVIVAGSACEVVPVDIAESGRNFATRQSAQGARIFGGLFASTPAVIPKARLAGMLPAGSRYPVVEMESAAVAIIAAENGISFAGIRAVSDPFDEELDFSLEEFCDDRMRVRIPRVLLTILRKPRIVPQLVRLARNSRIAGNSLADAVEKFLVSV